MVNANEVRIDNSPDKKIDVAKIKSNVKKNPWMISTLVVAVIAILLLVMNMSGIKIGGSGLNGTTGASIAISADEAGEKILEFAESRGAIAELVEVNDEGDLYEVVVVVQGQELPLYVTKDGKYFVQGAISFDEIAVQEQQTQTQTQPASADVPKSDKPVVELFVMSHCPYGTQAEKGILPVYKLLGDKIDSNIRFVYYAMHPSQGEVEEELNQYCIQEEQNDRYYDYLTCFLEDGDGERCLDKIEIDKVKLEECYARADEEFEITKNLEDKSLWLSGSFPLFNTHADLNDQYGVGGSPTLVVNGEQASSGRDSASYLSVICNAFNEAPEECDEVLSSASPSPGFGFSASGGSVTEAQCS